MLDKKIARKIFVDAVYSRVPLDDRMLRCGIPAELLFFLCEQYAISEQALISAIALMGSFSNQCRYCSMPVSESDAAITNSYWKSLMFVAHAACDAAGRR